MSRQEDPAVSLSPKERQTLMMVIQGMGLDAVAESLHQSRKVVQKYIRQSLRKLDHWSIKDFAPPNFNSAADTALGFLTPREGERAIFQSMQRTKGPWGCVVIIVPTAVKGPGHDILFLGDVVSNAIQRCFRRSDIVIKWASQEWVIFLSAVSASQTALIVNRMKELTQNDPPMSIGWGTGSDSDSFEEVFEGCHRKVVSQYVRHDLEMYTAAMRRK